MKSEKRSSEDGMFIIVDWDNKKRITKGIAQGTYYCTFYLEGTFAGWRTKKDIISQYPNGQLKKSEKTS